MKKLYTVWFYYTENGHTTIEANSEAEAEKILYNRLAENGTDDLNYRTTDREYSATNSMEQVKRNNK